jgi:hypothetical protein
LLGLLYFTQSSAPKVANTTTNAPLRSYLVIKPSQPSVESAPAPSVTMPAAPVNNEANATTQTEELVPVPVVTQPVPTPVSEPSQEQVLTITSDVATQQNQTTISKSQIDNAFERFQNNLQSQQVQRFSEIEARAFRQAQTSPEIIAPEVTLTPEQREAQKRRIITDCSNAAKKGMSIIIGFMGGSINCHQNPDFQQYIDKRLNKNNQDESRQ